MHVILAEVEAFHSRPIAPTRRIALGRLELPCDPAPGFGGILLGGIVARFAPDLDEDTTLEVLALLSDVEHDRRIPQPRARHRLQVDRVGLRPCHHRLVGRGEVLAFDIDGTRGTPAQHVLCAVYAAGTLTSRMRPTVVDSLRKGLRWHGDVGPSLAAHLAGPMSPRTAAADPVAWAIEVLRLDRDHGVRSDRLTRPPAATPAGSDPAGLLSRREVQHAFRERLREAHPDHGAADEGAAQRIAELSEARRILLG